VEIGANSNVIAFPGPLAPPDDQPELPLAAAC
jgi:hypothetical protein